MALQITGNGVVTLVAAYAFISLYSALKYSTENGGEK